VTVVPIPEHEVNMHMMPKILVLAVVLLALPVSAQTRHVDPPPAGTKYSLLGGETVGSGVNVASGEVGWPGISFGITHGLNRDTDIGARFDLLFGFEETTNSQFGIGFRVPLRLTAMRRDRISVLVHIDPGLKIYTTSPAIFGLQFPIGVVLGYAAQRDLTVGFGVDLPMTLIVTPSPVQLVLGPTFGPAVEFHVDPRLAVGLNTRFGPIFSTRGGGSEFGFVMQVLLAYRM
jgi:hypothetical protein